MKHDENGFFMKMINDSDSTAEAILPTAVINVFLLSTWLLRSNFWMKKVLPEYWQEISTPFGDKNSEATPFYLPCEFQLRCKFQLTRQWLWKKTCNLAFLYFGGIHFQLTCSDNQECASNDDTMDQITDIQHHYNDSQS